MIPILLSFAILFSYVSIYGFRLSAIFIIIALLRLFFLFISPQRQSTLCSRKNLGLHMFSIIIFMLHVFYSIYNSSFTPIFQLTAWMCFLYWPYLLSTSRLKFLDLNLYLKYYLLACIVAALSVCLQYLIYYFSGIVVGNIIIYSGRIAAVSFWQDPSFLSVFIATGASLALASNFILSNKLKYILVLYLLMSSVLTSSRLGIVSFLLSTFFLNIKNLTLSIKRQRFPKWFLFTASSLLVLFIVFSPLMNEDLLNSFERIYKITDFGRLHLIELQHKFSLSNLQNFLFGSIGDYDYFHAFGLKNAPDLYVNRNHSMIAYPHNLLYFFLAYGGLFLFIPSLFYLFFLAKIALLEQSILPPFLLALTATFFIPYFYSTYFIALLCSFAILARLINSNRLNNS